MNLPSLYELASELQIVRQQMLEGGMDEQTIADTIDSLALPFEQKAVGIRRISLEVGGQADLCDAAAKALQERAKALRAGVAKREEYIIRNMLAADIKAIPDALTPLTLRANPAAVVIEDESAIPFSFMRTPEPKPPVPAPDKKAIKAAIEAGMEVPGASLVKGWRLL